MVCNTPSRCSHEADGSEQRQFVPGWVVCRCRKCGEAYSRAVTASDVGAIMEWPTAKPRRRKDVNDADSSKNPDSQ
jgi:hypothetical protein